MGTTFSSPFVQLDQSKYNSKIQGYFGKHYSRASCSPSVMEVICSREQAVKLRPSASPLILFTDASFTGCGGGDVDI